jgi:glycosyltransferase involved in cell wall biosynthesis
MRVLAITVNMLPNSGWGRYARSVCFETARRGHRTSVLTYKKDGEAVVEGNCKEYSELHAKLSFISVFKNILTARRLAKDVDVVHAFDLWPFLLYGYGAVLGTNKKLFVTGVGTYSVVPFNYVLKRFFLTRALKRTARIFVMSEYTKKRMLEKIKVSNFTLVHWGSTPLPKVSPERLVTLREKFNIKDEHPIILTVGQLKQRKGHFDVLKAIDILKEKYPSILYCMVGSVKDNKVYVDSMLSYAKEKNIEKHMRIVTDAKSDEDLAFFYQTANMFVMASNSMEESFEGFGIVFLEAEQFGKPVVSS